MNVPSFDARREFARERADLLGAVERTLESGQYILGPEVAGFEEEAAAYLDVAHAIGVASGTDALWLALRAIGVGPDDPVVMPAFTFFATASATLNTGARPVFCDIDPATFNLDPTKMQRTIDETPGVKAAIVVHLYGQPAPMGDITEIARDRGVPIVEDTAQAFGAEWQGAKAGAIGEVGAHSFFPTKNLGGFGDGGLVTTADDAIADRVAALRGHGSRRKYVHELVGTNSRLDAVQAAMLRVRLARIDSLLDARRRHATAYDEALADLDGMTTPACHPDALHTYNQYVVRIHDGRRDEVAQTLGELGVGTAVYYPGPVHLQKAVEHLGYRPGDFPAAELACAEVLALPVAPTLAPDERDHVIDAMRKALGA